METEFLHTKQVARLLSVSVSALEKGRVGIGNINPPYHRFGKAIRYLRHEVLAWAAQFRAGKHRG